MNTIEEIKTELGSALLEGASPKVIEGLRKDLAKAEAAAKLDATEQEAIAAATSLLARRAEQAKADEAAADLAKRWKQAETDLNDLHATVAAKDRLLEKLKDLNEREAHQARAYVANYSSLGISSAVASEILLRSWNGQLVQKLKSDCGLFSFLPQLLVYGVPGKAVAACVPVFDRIFPRAPKKAIEHKEAA